MSIYPEQSDPHKSLVGRGLIALVAWVCRFPWPVLVISLSLCALAVYASCTRLEYHTQRSDLISPHKDYQQRWRQYLAEFGDDDDIVVVVQGEAADRQQMEEALESLATKVKAQPKLFDRLLYKADLRGLHNRALLFLPPEAIKPIQDNIKSMRLLLDFGPYSWRTLSLLSLVREARQRAGHIAADQPLSPNDREFLTQLVGVSRSATAVLANPDDYHNPWGSLLARPPDQQGLLAEPQYFFNGDGTLAFLLVRAVKEPGKFTAGLHSVTTMRAIVADTRATFPKLEFGLTGLPVLETDEMVAAEHDTKLALWLSIAGVTLLFFLVYRSLYYPILTVVTLLVGTAWAMGWLTLTVGHLNILSATFAVMLIGMGDYGVLWVMRYEQARREGADVRSALLHTTTHVAVGNLTAAATLALAFYAAMLADFQAVAELGWIAGSGVLLCALACFTVLPALLTIFDRRRSTSQESGLFRFTLPTTRSSDESWLPSVSARPRWVIGVGVGLSAILALCACRVWYDHNLLHLQARDLESVKWEMTLIQKTAGASLQALSYTSTPEEAVSLKERYEKLKNVCRAVEIASLVPRDQEAKLPMLKDIQHRLRGLPARGSPIPHALPKRSEVQAELGGLIVQLEPLGTSQPLLGELQLSLIELDSRMKSMPAEDSEKCLQHFDERLAGDLADDLHRLRDVSTPATIALSDLPGDLRDRYIGRTGKWLVRVLAKDCLWEFAPLEEFTTQIRTVDPEATGRPFATLEGLKAMKNGLRWAGVYALLAIVTVLLIDFRNWRFTLIALAPLAMGVICSLGIMGLCGVALNPANMIAFPLILGVGVDNGVHILHDWLLRRREGKSTISYPIGRGVLVKALTTMIGFGTLMISSQQGLASLGLILTLGVGCCMLASLVFLPAVLGLIEKREQVVAAVQPPRQRRLAA